MGLRSYIAKRLVYSFILVLAVLSFNFYLFMVMPGNPVALFMPQHGLTEEQFEQMKKGFERVWGLDKPLHLRYLTYLSNMFQFKFGKSIINDRPVAEEIMYRLPWTIELMGLSTILAIIIGIVFGVMAAYKRGTILDTGSVATALMLNSLPVFWFGMVFILIFSIWLGWFPTAHAYPEVWSSIRVGWPQALTIQPLVSNGIYTTIRLNPNETLTLIGGLLRHLALPLLTLTLFQYGGFLLLTRAVMLESLTEDYIITARAKGVPERNVLFRHALKNASLPLITSIALSFGFMISGATITETVYTWPGMGWWMYQTVVFQDYFGMQAFFYIIALCVIVANIIADLLYGVIDPRIRYG